jgi:DNA-binding CsgD family transcriptional regulator
MHAASRAFDPLIEQIYGAIGRPELWGDVLADITARMKGERALIYIHDLKANRLLFSAGYRVDPKYIALYEEKHLAGPLLPRIMQLTAGSLLTDKNPIMTAADMRQSTFYRDVLAPLNVYYASVSIILRQQDALGMLWVARSHDAGIFGDEEGSAVLPFVPHLCRAAQLHYRFLATELERAAAASALDRLTHAVVICDGKARVIFANAPAKKLLAGKRGLRLVADRLAGATAAQSNALVDAIGAIAMRERNTASVVLESADETFRVLISRASAELRLGARPQADLVLVSFSDPAADQAASAEVLKEMLQLTGSEARVTLGLAHGKTMDDIAADFDVSLNTVRTHVASAFAKTQTSRQADLVRVVLRTVGPFGFG